MKINTLLTSMSLTVLLACNTQKSNKKAMTKMDNTPTIEMEKKHSLELKKGELFLVAIADQKEGKEQLLQEYFGTIMPSAMKNGFTPLGQLHIDHINKADGYTPNNFIGLFKWPKMEAIQAFMSEFTPEQLKALRLPIWNEFKAHMVAFQEDKKLIIDESKLYEVKTIWTKEMLNTNSITENGGRIILDQAIIGYEDLHGNDAPNHILIIEWNDKETADMFTRMNMLKPQKEEAFYTHFTLFP